MPSVLALLFALFCAPVLVVFAIAVPAGEVPDEPAHIVRADSVRHGQLSGFRWWRLDAQGERVADAAVMADTGLVDPGLTFMPGAPLEAKGVTLRRARELLAWPWANRLDPVSATNTAVYPPTLYVPAAVALHVAKHAGAGPAVSIICARLMNGAVFAAMGVAALVLARRGRAALFAALCLPMSLSLAASVNPDGLVIGCGGLAAALLTRSTVRSWWGGVLLFCVAAMAKPYLLPLCLVVLATVPGGLRRHRGRAAGGIVLAAGPAVAWAVAMAAFVAAPFVRGAAHPGGPLYAGEPGRLFNTNDPGEQLRILLAVPSRLVTLPLDSLWAKGEWLAREAVGVMGTLDVVLPFTLYDLWFWALAAAVLAGFMGGALRAAGRGLAAAAGLVGAVWLAYVLQYLSWSEVGDALISGFQGRYIIPAAVFAVPVAAFAEGQTRAGQAVRAVLVLPVVLLAAADMVILPAVVLWSYYVR